jgi:hypothetical protein
MGNSIPGMHPGGQTILVDPAIFTDAVSGQGEYLQ